MVKICKSEYVSDDKYKSHFNGFPFELSDFQKYAIEGIIENKHVLVTAHTGSGKTLPAEFAIEYFVKEKGKKVIYTSPIKALSNQKFHEFSEKFKDIDFGILTGDIKFNPEADVLIMTTEILQNTLFQYTHKHESRTQSQLQSHTQSSTSDSLCQFNMDIDNDLACVIFDEVHYINDEDRGKVWEQTIMMLPNEVQMVMLSATIDKPERFATWCESQQHRSRTPSETESIPSETKEVYLIPTEHRVVPLYHHMYLDTNQSIYKSLTNKEQKEEIKRFVRKPHLLRSSSEPFCDAVYHKTKKIYTVLENERCRIHPHHVLNNLCTYLKEQNLLPAICFVFSRRNVEKYASQITANLLEEGSKIPSIVDKECKTILRKLGNHHEITELNEYRFMIQLLEKGIAIHHSGILPILREMVEILFAKGYIKILFATETFAVGINMPTKTVIFTALHKYTQNGMRYLYSHEYTQMAGRAGRRNIDTEGHVIHCCNLFQNQFPSFAEYGNIVGGTPQTLKSKFRINYALVIKLLKAYNDETEHSHEHALTDLDMLYHIQERFIKSSMYYDEIKTELEVSQQHLKTIEDSYVSNDQNARYKLSKYTNEQKDACKAYKILCDEISHSHGNKKKKLFKKKSQMIQEITSGFHAIDENDIDIIINEMDEDVSQTKHIEEETKYVTNMQNYVKTRISQIYSVLQTDGIIYSYNMGMDMDIIMNKHDTQQDESQTKSKSIVLSKRGVMVSYINEVNPIVLGTLIHDNDRQNHVDEHEKALFYGLTIHEFIGFLSTFHDVKVSEDCKCHHSSNIKHNSLQMTKLIDDAQSTYNKYISYETQIQISSGEFSEELMQYDLIDYVIDWTYADNESQCRNILQRLGDEKGIFLGDFSKCLLKIYNIINEINNVYTHFDNVPMMHYLKSAPELILKYVVTNQSLYI